MVVMFLGCCGIMGFFGSRESVRQRAEQETREKESAEQAQKELASGDGLWTSGKKSDAATKYRGLLTDKYERHLSQEDRGRVYSRLIDFEYESGNSKAGSDLIENADKKGVGLQLSHAEAKTTFAVFQTEKKRLAAEQAERDRLARRSPEDRLREAKPGELFDAVQLQNDFVANAVASNENYKNKSVIVQGLVFSVETGGLISNHKLYLCDQLATPVMACHLSSESAKSAELRSLRRGVVVRVMGTCRGRDEVLMQDGTTRTVVDMRDCRFVIVSH